MPDTVPDELKNQVRAFWNEQSCDTQVAGSSKFTREYFEEIERFRYRDQPFIHSFAQFSRYHGQRVLEVGFGAGTDFIQWVRSGARANGIDLTPEALENLRHRLAVYGLTAENIQVGDAEALPFESGTFDLAYSFGVLHHTPDTRRAVDELIRVVRPGGEIKLMLYNRRSIYIFNLWVKHALLRGRPWRGLKSVLWHHMESPGTKGYTRGELRAWLAGLPLRDIEVRTELTSADYLSASAFAPLNKLYRLALLMAGDQRQWRPQDYSARVNDPNPPFGRASAARSIPARALFTGNRWGFFHCIRAVKAG